MKEDARKEEQNWQYYRLLEVSIEVYQDNTSEELLEKLIQALELTKPRLDYSDLCHELLIVREAIKLGEELMKSLLRYKSHITGI